MDKTAVKPKKIDFRRWRHTDSVKLKDRAGRGSVFYNLEGLFGFRPQWVSITKVQGQHDRVVLSVEIPDEQWEKQLKAEESLKKAADKAVKGDGTGKSIPGTEKT